MLRELLDRFVPHRELGWSEIGEEFTRYTLLKTSFAKVFLHRLVCPVWPRRQHDHPWNYVAIILYGGYAERVQLGDHATYEWCRPGRVLFRSAVHAHSVTTKDRPCWSLVITGPKRREWGFVDG
jgi:hypothetical protein